MRQALIRSSTRRRSSAGSAASVFGMGWGILLNRLRSAPNLAIFKGGGMDSPEGAWTRRQFLERVGKAGGAAAVYETMVALGLVRVPEALAAPPPSLPPGSLEGVRVLVLGAGVGGLTAAWRLAQAHADVNVLEAAGRIGGRNFTVRQGDRILQKGRSDQECRFTDKELYFNAGPGRIPYHHTAVIDLCKEIGVALEVYI